MHELKALRMAVDRLHECKARHLKSVPVKEIYQGKTVWDGVVEVFELSGHSPAKRCYIWGHWEDEAGKQTRIVTVLGVPPIDSPLAAVRAAIARPS